ncbi:MAG: tetratricopeptide repeat protein [Rhodospirillales bacterium]
MRNLAAATFLGLGLALTAAADGTAGILKDIEEGFDEAFFGAFKSKRVAKEKEAAREAIKKEDYTEAMRLYETQIQFDDREALYETARMFEESKGRQAQQANEFRRLQQAALRYRRAADLGHADASYRYARLLARGIGVDQDYVAAAQYYQKAAIHDHGPAQHEYASMRAAGIGARQDEYAALTWYLIAAQRNDVSPAEPAAEALCVRLRDKMELEWRQALTDKMLNDLAKAEAEFKAAANDEDRARLNAEIAKIREDARDIRQRQRYTQRAPVDGYAVMPAGIGTAMQRAVDFTPEGPGGKKGKPGLPTWRCFSGQPEAGV